MEKYIILFCFILIQFSLLAQNTIDGEFEEWFCYAQEIVYPHGWDSAVLNTPCLNPELTANKTADSYEGNLAVEMTSSVCNDPAGGLRLQAGFLYTIETGSGGPYAPGWSRPYTERPEELSFYYKFHQEGTDSAAVYMLLFNYDTETHITDTVATASGYVHEQTIDYTEFVLPIDYYKEDSPSFIHILFICSKTIGDLGRVTYTPAYENAHPGTTLWIDNVVLRGGTVNTTFSDNIWNFKVYPNPIEDELYIDILPEIQINTIEIYDSQGRIIRQYDEPDNKLNMSDIPTGIYYLKLTTNKGIRFERIIKK